MLFDNNVDLDFTLLNLANLTNNNMSMNFTSDNRKFLSAKEGFIRGNIFKDEYKPYKNLTYINIEPKNDREAKLYNVMSYTQAINDMNLYLDIHSEDTNALNYLKELIKEEEKAKMEYENSYGSLNVCDTKGDKFEWIDSPWPWEGLGGNIYV